MGPLTQTATFPMCPEGTPGVGVCAPRADLYPLTYTFYKWGAQPGASKPHLLY